MMEVWLTCNTGLMWTYVVLLCGAARACVRVCACMYVCVCQGVHKGRSDSTWCVSIGGGNVSFWPGCLILYPLPKG